MIVTELMIAVVQALRGALVRTQSFALAEQSTPVHVAHEAFTAIGEQLVGEDGIAETVHDGPFGMIRRRHGATRRDMAWRGVVMR